MFTNVLAGPVYGRGPDRWLHELGPWLKKPDVQAFEARFGTEEACRDFLFQARFEHGFRCPNCAGTRARWLDDKRLRCLRCRTRVSLTAGTILDRTRKPLTDWFRAAFLVVHQGTSARTLQRVIKLTYKVAWTWAHKLRRVMGVKTTLDAPMPRLLSRDLMSASGPHTRISSACGS